MTEISNGQHNNYKHDGLDDSNRSTPLLKPSDTDNKSKNGADSKPTIVGSGQPQANTTKKKKKRRDKSDLGDDFVAPDGGWGWLVAIAAGVNTLVTFALAQQFGLIFRDHMAGLGISNPELTTIINTQIAISAYTGLLNGPLFRRFTFRAVAVVGSILTFLGLFIVVFANTFEIYILGFSIIYAFGRGLTVSASSLAVNTYFKEKRRTATAYLFGVAGLGPIVCPYFVTYLIGEYGVQGTVLLFAGASLYTIPCSLIYQPVLWHTKKPPRPPAEQLQTYDKQQIEPLNSAAEDESTGLKRLNKRKISNSHTIKEEPEGETVLETMLEPEQRPNYVQSMAQGEEQQSKHGKLQRQEELEQLDEEEEEERRKKLPFYKKIIIFFDLDLLRNITYVNLAVGLTLINFVEINFAILTPFILGDLGFDKKQVALAMSTLGFCDLVIRFLIPLITSKIKNWSNRTFFVVGILGMCLGRAFLSATSNFYCMMGIFIWLGLNKAFRTVFWCLIIPSYVPLKRLPAAAGLQLLMSGTFSMACGPIIGVIRDYTSYSFTLNVLNGLCITAIVLWYLEDCVRARLRKSPPVKDADME